MTDTNNPGVAPESQTEQLPKPGELIRMRREAAGMTQAQVGEALHLTMHYIRALENDEYRKLPGLTFVKGYFRAYARLLKIDEAEVLACYDRYVATLDLPETAQPQPLQQVHTRNDQAVSWALVAGLLLVAALGAGWWFFGRGPDAPGVSIIGLPQRAVQQAAPQNTDTAPAAAPAATAPAAIAVPASTAAFQNTMRNQGAAPAVAAAAEEVGQNVVSDGAPAESLGGAAAAVQAAAVEALGAAGAVDAAAVADEAAAATDAAADAAEASSGSSAGSDAADDDAAAVVESAASDNAVADGVRGSRRVELQGNGTDRLQLQFSDSSWVEVDDAARVRLYSGMMNDGDLLSIRATAPFHVLLGNARGVALQVNETALALESAVRDDNTARVRVSEEGLAPWVVQ